MNKKNNSDLLLSLAVFKKLYDEKMDIYQIISSFIKCQLKDQKTDFGLVDMTNKVNNEYGFDIPQAVIKTSLKRIIQDGFLELSDKNYKVIKQISNKLEIKKDSNLARQQKQNVIDKIEKHLKDKGVKYTDIEKSLENYILNKQDDINTHIDACIIENSSNEDFVNALNDIKYGLVLYEGISYGIEDINPKKWDEKIVFLDTEILFYLAGYNGELFKQIANDFLSLVKIVNKNKRIIKLQFIEVTKEQIESIFYVAELIISGKKRQEQSNEAVRYILDSCKDGSASDIVIKKTEFYDLLSKKGIKLYEDNIDYNNEQNHKNNLSIDCNLPDFDNNDHTRIKQLNIVNILRGNNTPTTLYKTNILFVTQTNATIQFSIRHKKENGGFPLALRLFDITNQLWIKTNKGLSNKDSLPATFDIRNKARIALSHSLEKKVCEEYDKIIKNNEKNIEENSTIDKVAELKRWNLTPDDIDEENCGEVEDIIAVPEKISEYYEEKSYYKGESERKGEIIKELEDRAYEDKIEKLELKKKVEDDDKRKNRNKIIAKRFIIIFIAVPTIFTLEHYQDFIIETIPFINNFILNTINLIGSSLAILLFFGVDLNKIKSFFRKDSIKK